MEKYKKNYTIIPKDCIFVAGLIADSLAGITLILVPKRLNFVDNPNKSGFALADLK